MRMALCVVAGLVVIVLAVVAGIIAFDRPSRPPPLDHLRLHLAWLERLLGDGRAFLLGRAPSLPISRHITISIVSWAVKIDPRQAAPA
jgi:hypothetical protein